MWAQTNYSASYNGNITLSTTGGSNATNCKVIISDTEYDGVKAGTSKNVGAVRIVVPQGTKYLHLHVGAWNGENVSLAVTPTNYSISNISLTANSGISGSSNTYTFGTKEDDKTPNSEYHYKVITFRNALTDNTYLTFTATGGKRFVVWGVYSEAESNDPSSEAAFADKTPSINYPAQKTYSQAPTTAAGYNGTITYSMTENNAGATIDESTGVVTVTGGGSVTVKAIAAAVSGSFASSEDSYTLTVTDTRAELGNDLAWSAESATVTYGADNNVFPTLTNTHNVAVTYESTNTDAATIDANTGVITLKDVTQTAYIKAIFAGNDDYLPKTVEYTLNVTKAPFTIRDGVFDFVEAAQAGEDYDSNISPTSNGQYYETEDATWTAGNVTMITSQVTGSGYRWWSKDGTLRFYNGSKATFSVPNGYVITKIVTTGANFDAADPAGLSNGTWTGASNEVALSVTNTRNIKTITVTYTTATQAITPAYAKTTYVTPYKMDFTGVDGLKAYVATDADADGVTMTEVTAAVPENTPLLLKGTAGTTYNVPVAASATAPATNKLRAGDGTTVFDGSTYDYLLYSDGKFYQIGSGTIATNKAYLHLESDPAGARALDIIFDGAEASSISDAVKSVEKNEGYFDLQGRRVAQPTKGLYIVNGKKVIVK